MLGDVTFTWSEQMIKFNKYLSFEDKTQLDFLLETDSNGKKVN